MANELMNKQMTDIDKLKERWEKRGYEVIVHDIKQ